MQYSYQGRYTLGWFRWEHLPASHEYLWIEDLSNARKSFWTTATINPRHYNILKDLTNVVREARVHFLMGRVYHELEPTSGRLGKDLWDSIGRLLDRIKARRVQRRMGHSVRTCYKHDILLTSLCSISLRMVAKGGEVAISSLKFTHFFQSVCVIFIWRITLNNRPKVVNTIFSSTTRICFI